MLGKRNLRWYFQPGRGNQMVTKRVAALAAGRPAGLSRGDTFRTWVSHLWLSAVARAAATMPRPSDAPHAQAMGPNSDRILIIGGGTTAGWGVDTHQSALTGCVSHSLAALTGRGNFVDLRIVPRASVGVAIDQVANWELSRYDAVVVCLGTEEAIRLRRVNAWRDQMELLLRSIRMLASLGTPAIVVGIPSTRAIPRLGSTIGALTNRRAMAMNQASNALCDHAPDAYYLELSAVAPTAAGSGWRWLSESYATWGAEIAVTLRFKLPAQGHRDSDRLWQRPHTITIP